MNIRREMRISFKRSQRIQERSRDLPGAPSPPAGLGRWRSLLRAGRSLWLWRLPRSRWTMRTLRRRLCRCRPCLRRWRCLRRRTTGQPPCPGCCGGGGGTLGRCCCCCCCHGGGGRCGCCCCRRGGGVEREPPCPGASADLWRFGAGSLTGEPSARCSFRGLSPSRLEPPLDGTLPLSLAEGRGPGWLVLAASASSRRGPSCGSSAMMMPRLASPPAASPPGHCHPWWASPPTSTIAVPDPRIGG